MLYNMLELFPGTSLVLPLSTSSLWLMFHTSAALIPLSLSSNRSCWAWRTTWRSWGTCSWTFSCWWRSRALTSSTSSPTWRGRRTTWPCPMRSSSWRRATRRRTRSASCAAAAARPGDAAYEHTLYLGGRTPISTFSQKTRLPVGSDAPGEGCTNAAALKTDSAEQRKQLGGKRPEMESEALVSFKRMWDDCDWKRQFSECCSPTPLLIRDLHCHLTEVTNKGRPLPLPHQQHWDATFLPPTPSVFFLPQEL